MLDIVIGGPFGRMGQALCRLANENKDMKLSGGLVAAGKTERVSELSLYSSLKDIPDSKGYPRVLIDFTETSATMKRLDEAAEQGIPVVVGTTGFSEAQLTSIQEISKRLPVLLSANMSLGVNLLLDVVQKLSARLSDYDIEIIETHHHLKKDAPSGTALAFGNAAAAGRKVRLEQVAKNGRVGITGKREAAEIGIHAVRGGDVVGDHTILFAGLGERVEVTHKASSRDTFAAGALYAAKFLAEKPAGLYSMKDALEL